MAGYTRQSIADIINGADITAPPLNAEFNQLSAAFNGTTGHTHDGTSGNGAKINLATSVQGYLLPANGGLGGRNNFAATSTPLATNDVTEGYVPGSLWENVSNGRVYICVGNSTAAAVWRELVQVDGVENALVPATTAVTDIGTPTTRYQDLWLSGGMSASANSSIGGTLTVTGATTVGSLNTGALTATGLSTLTQVDANSGTIDGTVIGGNSPSAITGTTITANSGFVGSVTGNVTGNLTSTGTSSFNNITASGTISGAVVGTLAGNVTATTGSSSFNDVTINGTLNMNAGTSATITNLTTPVNGSDAATKLYVDTAVANLIDGAPGALDTLNELAAAIGDNANYAATITTALAGKVADTGDTMTGNLSMSGGATVTGIPLPASANDAASKAYVDQQDALQVTRTGDTMSGPLSMGGNKVTNVGTPTLTTDAANKSYVDAILGSATAAASSAAAAATSEANAALSAATALQSENDARDWAIKTTGTVDGTNYSAKYWATFTTVQTVSSNIANINLVGNDIANVNSVAGSLSAVDTVAANINNVTDFFDTYFVSATQPVGPQITVGDLWFDTTNQIMKVYSASGWQTAGSSINGTAQREDYVATAGQTSFAAIYDTGYVDVYLNGVKLAPTDFTASDGANVVLASAAASGDTVSIVSFGTFALADHYNKTASDARYALQDDALALAIALG